MRPPRHMHRHRRRLRVPVLLVSVGGKHLRFGRQHAQPPGKALMSTRHWPICWLPALTANKLTCLPPPAGATRATAAPAPPTPPPWPSWRGCTGASQRGWHATPATTSPGPPAPQVGGRGWAEKGGGFRLLVVLSAAELAAGIVAAPGMPAHCPPCCACCATCHLSPPADCCRLPVRPPRLLCLLPHRRRRRLRLPQQRHPAGGRGNGSGCQGLLLRLPQGTLLATIALPCLYRLLPPVPPLA